MSLISSPFPDVSLSIPKGDILASLRLQVTDVTYLCNSIEAAESNRRHAAVIELRENDCTITLSFPESTITTKITMQTLQPVQGIVKFGMNAGYFRSALQAASHFAREFVLVEVRGETSPLIFRSESTEDEFALVAPMQISA